ncbi:MAG: protein translocase subunit SecD [Patescibacteria group bacterium]
MSSRKKIWISLALILALTVFAGLVDWQNVPGNNAVSTWFRNQKIKLGLDLQGGTHLVYQADTSAVPADQRESSLAGVRDVIERRINVFGVSEPVVQTNKVGEKWRVIIELPGVKDVNEAIKMIGETPLLEFKEQKTAAEDTEKASIKQAAEDALTAIKATPGDFTKISQEKSAAGTNAAYKEEDFKFKDEIDSSIREKVWGMSKGVISQELIGGNDGYIYSDGQLIAQEGFYIVKVDDKKTGVNREIKNEKEVKASHILISYSGAEKSQATRTKKEAEDLAKEILAKAKADGADFAALARENSDDSSAAEGGDLGFFKKGQMTKNFEDAAFAMSKDQVSDVVETEFGYHIIKMTDIKEESTENKVEDQVKYSYLFYKVSFDPWKLTGLSGKQLETSTVEFNQTSTEPYITLKFNEEGKKLFADITARNVGKPVAIFLDGEPISIPTVQEAISGGEAVISGKFSLEEAKLLSQRLRAGALPVPIELVSQQNVGPSLGKVSLDKSLMAGLIGLVLVALFMIGYYRLPGLLAVLALVVYTTVLFAVFKLTGITLTLAGIAGLILSIGMAVDANVLVFERLKEERKIGKPINDAVVDAFNRAWPSIRDGNYSTLITCFILYYFGTSSIRGFGLTLAAGIILSIFSSMVVTKLLMVVLAESRIQKIDWLWGFKKTLK